MLLLLLGRFFRKSGGICTIWDPECFSVDEMIRDCNFVTIKGKWASIKTPCGIINVYAPQDVSLKAALWIKITDVINADSELIWIICGDFNEVRNREERKGSIFDPKGAFIFNEFIDSNGLIDIKLGGRKFTWMGSGGSKLSKLNRFLTSPNFFDHWLNASATVLARIHSDHCPILLDSKGFDFGPVPFRFFNSWLHDPDLANVVSNCWNLGAGPAIVHSKMEMLSRKLKSLKSRIKTWRVTHVEENKKQMDLLKKSLDELDIMAESSTPDDEKIRRRAEISLQLSELESQKLLDLKQKAKSKWVLEGDENSRFFHGLIKNNIRRSRIHGLNIDGVWTSEPEKVKEEVYSFFSNKFKENIQDKPKFRSGRFRALSVEQKVSLEIPISYEEVKQAVWNCGTEKAPGPDGFTFAFIKKFWETIGDDVFNAVKYFEEHGIMNPGSNSSFITLIPKVKDPLSLSDYRPINLIGCISKIISKVLADRLKTVMDSVVSREQTAFIKGRSILDGPLVVNEIINWAKKRNKKKLIFKVDFGKAFDSISWVFLDDILTEMGFGNKWR